MERRSQPPTTHSAASKLKGTIRKRYNKQLETVFHNLEMPVQRASGQRTLGYCPSAEDPAPPSKEKSCTGEGGEKGQRGGRGGEGEKKGRREKKKVVVVVVVVFALCG